MTSNKVVASIGLISDTHYQDRLCNLPDGLAHLWASVDLILHAGDVGELAVLDRLGEIAPVVAVQGNDEPNYVKQELPNQQLIAAHGLRVLLWHSHYPDPAEEKAKRPGSWGPKLDRIANRGRDVRADVVVYGHTHVPMIYRYDDIVLVNPGALASGSYFTRQATISVGKLQVLADRSYKVIHLNTVTEQPEEFTVAKPDEDFSILANQYQEWMIEPELIPDVGALGKLIYENVRLVVRAVVPLYQRCLTDGPIRRKDLIAAIRSSNLITPNDRKQVLAVIERNA